MTAIVVNGVKRDVQAPVDTPLLYVLRNDLELYSRRGSTSKRLYVASAKTA
jgi:aerobic-type carbon monoxide dehydrogenase small subunit (CoxS/CutS family)